MISVVIVNYNGKEILRRCLKAIKKNTEVEYEIIVVDNNSVDGSCSMIKNNFPDVRVIENKDNKGYTRANNQGIRIADGRFIVLMNNDVEIKRKALDKLEKFLAARPDAGAAASKLVYPDGSLQGSVKALPTPASALFGRRSIITKMFPGNRFSHRYLIYLDQDFTKEFMVGSASSACLMVKKSVVDKIGLLDERYFMYWVDVDWCRRIHDIGLKIYCLPDSVAVHHEHRGGSRSSLRMKRRSIIDFNYGAYIYYCKYFIKYSWSPKKLAALTGLSLNAAGQLLLSSMSSKGSKTREAE